MLKLRSTLLSSALVIVAAVVLVGCAESPQADPLATDWQTGLDEDVVVALSELSEADLRAVLIQKVCPVTDKTLGSMGEPFKMIIEDREIYLCCVKCEATVAGDPRRYIAKLDASE